MASVSLFAQGTIEDYARAERLPRTLRGLTLNLRLRPQWSTDGEHLMYRAERPNGVSEYILVETATGVRKPAFDQAEFAKALSKQFQKPFDAKRLNLETIVFKDSGFEFDLNGKRWNYHPEKQLIAAVERPSSDAPSKAATRIPERPSRNGGEEIRLKIDNQSGGEVELFWVDTDGRRQSYGKIKHGERIDRHTFEGHVWTIIDARGRSLGSYEAGPTEAILVEPRRHRDTPENDDEQAEDQSDATSANQKTKTENADRWRVIIRDFDVYRVDRKSGEEKRLSDDGRAKTDIANAPRFPRTANMRSSCGESRNRRMRSIWLSRPHATKHSRN
ncbi:MAG: hypothetical protein QM811_12355 [Pirellulales bacterium]